MSSRTKKVAGGVIGLLLAVLLIPPLARRIDTAVDPLWEQAAQVERQYREMTNAYRIASEVVREHPTRRLWEERRNALLAAGYIEVRELRMRHSLGGRGDVEGFFAAFQTSFPGVECSVRNVKSDAPTVVVTARKSDLGALGAVERFVVGYQPKPR